MAYVALKPCRFCGQPFIIGDSVPDEVILPGAAKNLIKMGLIAEQTDTNPAPAVSTQKPQDERITIKVNDESNGMNLDITREGMQAVFDVLTGKASEVENIIEKITDGDALILLHMCDSRKTVKAAAETRAKAIESAGEQ